MNLYKALIITCLLPFFGCSDEPSNKGYYSYELTPVQKTRNVTDLANSYKLRCDVNNINCSPSVGVFFKKAASALHRCTSFIAGEKNGKTIMATNKHCLGNSSSCSSNIYFAFPPVGEYKRTGTLCEKILKISPYELYDRGSDGKEFPVDNPDYAFILLNKKIQRPVLRSSQAGLDFSSNVTAHYFDDANSYSASSSLVLKSKSCKTASEHSFYSNRYLEARSPTVGLINCDVKPGNSGGPITNPDGDVAAIIHLTVLSGEGIPGINTELSEQSNFGSATNLSCINFELLNLNNTADSITCDVNKEAESISDSINYDQKTMQLLRSAFLNLVSLLESKEVRTFDWFVAEVTDPGKSSRSNAHTMLEILPSCIINPEDDRSDLISVVDTTSYFVRDNTQLRIRSDFNSLSYVMDEEGVVDLVVVKDQKLATYRFDKRALAQLKDGKKIRISEIFEGGVFYHDLEYCDIYSQTEERIELTALKNALLNLDDADLKDYFEGLHKE